MTNFITSSEYLVEQSISVSFAEKAAKQAKRTTSFQIGLRTDAQVEAICEITGLTRNKVLQFLLESGVELYTSTLTDAPEGHEVYQRFLDLVKEKQGDSKK